MVSLINFKLVDEELESQSLSQTSHQAQQHRVNISNSLQENLHNKAPQTKQIQDTSVEAPQMLTTTGTTTVIACNYQTRTTATNHHIQDNIQSNLKQIITKKGDVDSTNCNSNHMKNNIQLVANSDKRLKEIVPMPISKNLDVQHKGDDIYNLSSTIQTASCAPNFVVTWRNLKFTIEPKWHFSFYDWSLLFRGNNSIQTKSNSRHCVGKKVVLDQLDGSFRSGELTAILGPSGAGKTTLLDCLTGHRKKGLLGTIKISASCLPKFASSNINPQNVTSQIDTKMVKTHLSKASSECCLDQLTASTITKDNLKVSIIPQNDHLIGHLTVYETLNYASKMKNSSFKNFDHKLNIKRVAQQLGLMPCLSTSINKLSGGQYKRVSIAQELLSNPDILILDEPTSGLDAMTCFQTVQVLRKLADERRVSGQNQIAVVLTIHQPNTDVFQQFNHVYVVAHGGKCVYEGPPTNIESVINRVGLEFPSSSYNPATIIVEIAAGKFGLDVIAKLNNIQKKQYDFTSSHASSSSSTRSSLGPSEPSSDGSSSSANGDDDDCSTTQMEAIIPDDNNNNNSNDNTTVEDMKDLNLRSDGLINKAFVLDSTLGSDVPVVVVAAKHSPISPRSPHQHLPTPNESPVIPCMNSRNSGGGSGGGGGGGGGGGYRKSEKRLKLNSLNVEQKFQFWSHTYLHFHRSWISIVRDPLLCGMQLFLHISVPLMVSLVYGFHVGNPNACPRAGPMDIMAFALDPEDSALNLQQEVRTTIENIGYIFFKLYGIIFAAMTVTVLTFPLDMHVLVKEFRNGWYGLPSYFLGRTLADIPFQLTLPFLAMGLSYYSTGQPHSYLEWRFFSITGILILSSLIAQTQGLLFGAILMDRMKAAVFVAPAATTPIILFAGFLVRTQSIPRYLRPLSNLSYLRYAIEACIISRYGYNQCECDPQVFHQAVPELPPIARTMLDFWLSNFRQSANSDGDNNLMFNNTAITKSLAGGIMPVVEEITTPLPTGQESDLFGKLIDSLSKANSFGRNITSCSQVVPYPMIDYDLQDSQLFDCFLILISMLIITRLLTFFIVCFKVKRKV